MWKWMGLFLRKNNLPRCWGWLSLLNWIGALTLLLLLKLPPRKMEPLFVLWSFFLLRLLCISINVPYGHAWNTVVTSELVLLPSWYLELSDKLQKQICRIDGPSLAVSFEPLTHRHNVASLSLFYRYLVDVHLNWLNWFHFLILEVGLLVIPIDCIVFLSPFLNVTRMSMSIVQGWK